ncbi:MAG: pectinesterase family protein [Actinomycetota bacterium]
MNDKPRQKLREIIQKHGRSIVENPRRCENLLRDYCGEFRREISVLTMALEEQAVADLLSSQAATALPRKVLLARLTQRLCDNLALSESAAHWSISSWAWAFGLISDAELKANETERQEIISPPPTMKTEHPSQNASTPPGKITVSNKVLVVSATGGGDFTTIGDALRNAAPNSRLLVREGLYQESIVLAQTVEIEGSGAIEKIIVRSVNQSCVSMQTEKAVVRGLTFEGRGSSSGKSFFAVDIPGGALVLENCRISSDSLSGVAIHGANANPILRNCRIYDGADSGLYIFDNARAFLENCDVYRNANDNLAITQGANPTVKNCRIFDGNNGGIVVWGNGATATIEDCEITNHRLANVGIRQSANPIFRRCKISGGRDCGVFVQENGYGIFEECDVYGNVKAEIAVTDKSNTTLRGSTIHQGRESGVFIGNFARALVEGCNIYDNVDAGISIYGESAAIVRRCKIHRNGTVAVRVKENSRTKVENCDLRGNRVATWETEYGVIVERNNNRE